MDISWKDRNPLKCSETTLPANLVLLAKVVVVCFFLQNNFKLVVAPNLSFIPILDKFPPPEVSRILMHLALWITGVMILFNIRVRACAICFGCTLTIAMLGNPARFFNSLFFISCLMVLIGLYQSPRGYRFIRWQFVVMYLGSTLNKVFDSDWRSGRYIDYWLTHIRESAVYLKLTEIVNGETLGLIMAWGTMVTELFLIVAFSKPRLFFIGVLTAFVFHSASVVLAHSTFGIFYSVLVLALMLSFVHWPTSMRCQVSYNRNSRLHRLNAWLLQFTNVDGVFEFQESNGKTLQLINREIPNWNAKGLRALVALWLLNPLTYFILAAAMTDISFYTELLM